MCYTQQCAHVPQLSITNWKVKWPLRSTLRYAQLITQCYNEEQQEKHLCNQSSHQKIPMILAPQISITALKMKWPLCFAFSYVQLVTQHYKQRK